jgi:hypothetical protein
MVFGCFVCSHLPKAKAVAYSSAQYYGCVSAFPFARLVPLHIENQDTTEQRGIQYIHDTEYDFR